MNSVGATHESPLQRVLRRLSHRRADWLALGLITLAVIAFFAPVLFGGYWLPSGGGDLVSFLWPTYTFASRTLKSGQLPLWNPHLYGGAPYWADNQSSVLYPPNLLMMLLTDVPYRALEGLAMAHIWLAGAAMYICLRLLMPPLDLTSNPSPVGEGNHKGKSRGEEGEPLGAGIAPAAAALGASAFMLSDVFVTHIGNLNLIAAAAWLPLVFVGTWRALRDLKWRWAILAGAAFGLGTLAGHAQMSLFTVMVIGAAGLLWIGQGMLDAGMARHALPLRKIGKQVGVLGVVAVVGLGLSAGGWLPAIEMTRYTARTELPYDAAAKFSLPPKALIGLVAPWVYGRGPAAFSGSWDRVEVGYIGVIALVLAIAGVILSIRHRQTRGLGIFLTLVGVIAFLMALGPYFPLHKLAWEVLPGFRSVRAPARFVLLLNFAEAILAALAIDRLRRWLVVNGSNFKMHLSNRVWIAPVLVAAELIAFGATAEIDRRDPRVGYNHPEAVAWLASQPDQPFRIDTFPAKSWQPDAAARLGGPLYDSYGISNPLTIATYDTYYWAVRFRGSPTYNALGAKFVLSDSGPPGDASFVPVKETGDGLTVYLNQNAAPMALLVYQAVSVDSQPAAFERVHRPGWDARQVVVVENGPGLQLDTPPDAALSYRRYEASEIALDVSTPTQAYLVLSEVYYPGWIATIDGQPAPIYRANSTFRAIYIPTTGHHIVDMAFQPPLVYAGLGITTVTLLILAVLALNWIRRSPASQLRRA